jgi:hypothetical protein
MCARKMKAVDLQEQEVLARTLEEVRRKRQRRVACKVALLPLLLVAGGGWLAMHAGPSSETTSPPVICEITQAPLSSAGSLTVVEWKGGMPSLVEYSGEDLGKLELSFSLEPVVAFPDEIW